MSTPRPLPTFDLRLIPSFVAVAEELHFGRAAERLQIAQPALSRQISKLEEQLGPQLFVRSSREVTLTPAGEYFLTTARDIVERAAHARAAVREERGRLVVHLGDGLNPQITRAVTTFSAAHPKVRIRLIEGLLSEVNAAVVSGTADVGFDVLEGVDPDLAYAPIDRQPLGVASAYDHPLVSTSSARWTDLEGETLIVAPQGVSDRYSDLVRAQLHGFGVTVTEVEGRLSKGSLMALHVAAGEGHLVCPAYLFEPCPEALAWVPLVPVTHLEVGISWDDRRATPAVLRFVRWATAIQHPASPTTSP